MAFSISTFSIRHQGFYLLFAPFFAHFDPFFHSICNDSLFLQQVTRAFETNFNLLAIES